MNWPWHQYVLSAFFIFAGVMHFIRPKAFMRIMPRYLPNHKLLVFISGFTEILAGITLLFLTTKNWAAIGIIAMLIAFFPVHIYMIRNEKASLGLPKFILYFRLALQFGLVYWSYQYT